MWSNFHKLGLKCKNCLQYRLYMKNCRRSLYANALLLVLLYSVDCSASSIYHLRSEFWTSHHPTLLTVMSQQCEPSLAWPSGSRPQDHRSYESVRCHLLLQAPQWSCIVWNMIQQRPLLLRKVKASLSDSVVSHRSRRPGTFDACQLVLCITTVASWMSDVCSDGGLRISEWHQAD